MDVRCMTILLLGALVTALIAGPAKVATAAGTDGAPARRVVSLNLCSDELALLVAPEAVVSVTHLAADPDQSALADLARARHINHGHVEEILPLQPDLALAGAFTPGFTVALLERAGIPVERIPFAEDMADIRANVKRVAALLDADRAGERVVAEFDRALKRYDRRHARPVDAVLYEGAGITVGESPVIADLMERAGLNDVARQAGVTAFGALPLESLLLEAPELLIFGSFKSGMNSLSQQFLDHPALKALAADIPTARVETKYLTCGTPVMAEALRKLAMAGDRVRDRLNAGAGL